MAKYLSNKDLAILIFIIIFLLGIFISYLFNTEDVILAISFIFAMFIYLGMVINFRLYMKKRHRGLILVIWCFLIIISGPIAFIFHEILYSIIGKERGLNE